MKIRLGDYRDFNNGYFSLARKSGDRYPVYGVNGVISCVARCNACVPLVVVGRVGSY